MIPMMPMSPSSLKLSSECLGRYQARHVTKEVVSTFGGPSARRGIIIHALIEHTIKLGEYSERPIKVTIKETSLDKDGKLVRHTEIVYATWADHQIEWSRCKEAIEHIWQFQSEGWSVLTEEEVAIDVMNRECGFWDEQCYMRGKIDLLLVSPDKSLVIIWDWKTGKAKNINELQLPFLGMILTSRFGMGDYAAVDFMIDEGEPFRHILTVDRTVRTPAVSMDKDKSQLADVCKAVKNLINAHMMNTWPFNPGSHCRWCELTTCLHKR